jgi:hypothetical protein
VPTRSGRFEGSRATPARGVTLSMHQAPRGGSVGTGAVVVAAFDEEIVAPIYRRCKGGGVVGEVKWRAHRVGPGRSSLRDGGDAPHSSRLSPPRMAARANRACPPKERASSAGQEPYGTNAPARPSRSEVPTAECSAKSYFRVRRQQPHQRIWEKPSRSADDLAPCRMPLIRPIMSRRLQKSAWGVSTSRKTYTLVRSASTRSWSYSWDEPHSWSEIIESATRCH